MPRDSSAANRRAAVADPTAWGGGSGAGSAMDGGGLRRGRRDAARGRSPGRLPRRLGSGGPAAAPPSAPGTRHRGTSRSRRRDRPEHGAGRRARPRGPASAGARLGRLAARPVRPAGRPDRGLHHAQQRRPGDPGGSQGVHPGQRRSGSARTGSVPTRAAGGRSSGGPGAQPGRLQPEPVLEPVGTRTVVAPWRRDLTVDTTGWRPGFYVFKLRTGTGWDTLVPYVVSSPVGRGDRRAGRPGHDLAGLQRAGAATASTRGRTATAGAGR